MSKQNYYAWPLAGKINREWSITAAKYLLYCEFGLALKYNSEHECFRNGNGPPLAKILTIRNKEYCSGINSDQELHLAFSFKTNQMMIRSGLPVILRRLFTVFNVTLESFLRSYTVKFKVFLRSSSQNFGTTMKPYLRLLIRPSKAEIQSISTSI